MDSSPVELLVQFDRHNVLLFIYARALEDPGRIIRQSLRRQFPDADLLENGSLLEYLSSVSEHFDGKLVIILDQFEEFFIRLGRHLRSAFIQGVRAIYDAHDLPVKLVFGLRED